MQKRTAVTLPWSSVPSAVVVPQRNESARASDSMTPAAATLQPVGREAWHRPKVEVDVGGDEVAAHIPLGGRFWLRQQEGRRLGGKRTIQGRAVEDMTAQGCPRCPETRGGRKCARHIGDP